MKPQQSSYGTNGQAPMSKIKYKKGDIGFSVMWNDDDTKFEFWEYRLRNVQNRKAFGKILTYHFWTPVLKGTTWGKRSKKHGDFGWLQPNATQFTTKYKESELYQYAPTKVMACQWELDDQKYVKLLGTQVEALERYIKRYSK